MHPMDPMAGYQAEQLVLAVLALGDFFAWLIGGLAVAAIVIGVGRWWSSR